MTKTELVKLLLDDFNKMFPNASRPERLNLYMRLNMMEIKDLELLVSQL
jgi:hypothetical protein